MKVKASGPNLVAGRRVFMGDSVVLFLILSFFFVQLFVLRRLRSLFVFDSQILLTEPWWSFAPWLLHTPMVGSWRADLRVCCIFRAASTLDMWPCLPLPWATPSSPSSGERLSYFCDHRVWQTLSAFSPACLSHALIVKPHKSVCEELYTLHLLMLLCFFSSSVLFPESSASTHLPRKQLLQIHFPDPVWMSPLLRSLPNSPTVSVTLHLWSWSPTLFTIYPFTCLFMCLQGGGITKGKEQELCTWSGVKAWLWHLLTACLCKSELTFGSLFCLCL